MPTRSYEWQEAADIDVMQEMSGLEYCRRLIAGEYPRSPVVEMIGMRLQSVEHGRAVAILEPGPHLMHGRGVMHGGIVSILLDSVMAWAVLSTLERGRGLSTAHLGVDFVRPVLSTAGTLRAEAETVNGGRRVALCHARLVDQRGKLFASANSTCLLTGEATTKRDEAGCGPD